MTGKGGIVQRKRGTEMTIYSRDERFIHDLIFFCQEWRSGSDMRDMREASRFGSVCGLSVQRSIQ